MSGEEEIRLFGQPIRITVPGKSGTIYKGNNPSLKCPCIEAGSTYAGYALCDLKDTLWYRWRDIYIEVDYKLYSMTDYLSDSYIHDILTYVSLRQSEATYDSIHRRFIFLYEKINELQNRINDKVDRMEMD